jgi:hypothetical protein
MNLVGASETVGTARLRRPSLSPLGLALAGTVVIASLAGCANSNANSSAGPSTPASTPNASQTAAPTPSPTAAPSFVATGSLNVARMDATATLLQNGKVLIAGGSPEAGGLAGPSILSSAELYDPATGKFTATGSMRSARTGAAAALLPDGRVLIAGGYGCRNTKTCSPEDTLNGGDSIASAELYDPATGKFATTGSMSVSRCNATATPLQDGRVLVLNGGSEVAELYDPDTGKFSRDGSLLGLHLGSGGPSTVSYGAASAALLPNGKILILGPTDGPTAELFDPANGKSTRLSLQVPPEAAQSYSVAYESATTLADGRVLLSILDFLIVYDPNAGTFASSGSISDPGTWIVEPPTLLADGRLLFAGGFRESAALEESANAAAGLYDPAQGYRAIAPMPQARAGNTATLLTDGTVLIAGGTSDLGSALASAELFKP